MKFLAALSLATAVSALAVPPVEHDPAAHEDAKGSLQLIGSEIKSPETINVVRSNDEVASSMALEKRIDGIPIPHGVASAKSLLLAGVTVSFHMVGGWVRQGGRNVWTYTCKGIVLTNNNDRKAVSIFSAGIKYLTNYIMSEGRVWTVDAPVGGFADTVSINIGKA
ncbi:hypothetical protein CFIO01_00746 [Colletotrichum fioriniae PJ7]|uniref:Uncharacterized protein n=1 Tax=Colletotrichum fioriniae PJ7 TaxID=1445577 RepID=A0A010RZB6_9PEZI|nr:uncharacterized protein COL516b_008167 [Colletotrichum fioriniae]EXF83604.1 hypothetical protein CFIO01_00746 [Colletotrichum fioriniae PJ7]KAJ0300990.1 hypothetical protein COL516b_008167 [Colletotrichum fioriniae]